MIVTAHQPNFAPGASVCRKLQQADVAVLLDCVQFSKGGFTARNRLPDGTWMTVPIVKATDGGPIREVLISNHFNWRTKLCQQVSEGFPAAPFTERFCGIVDRPWHRLVGLNHAVLQLLPGLPELAWESHLAPRGDNPISEHLASLVAEVGGDVYLSGPSGRRYLDVRPFHARGIDVTYFKHDGANPSMLGYMA